MRVNSKSFVASAILFLLFSASSTFAKVDESEAAKLSNELTPIGAERAGNGGAIPAWNGGLSNPDVDQPREGIYPDPFFNDQIQFVIDQSNVDQYEENLSPGQVAMLKMYSTYSIPVYETRRTSTYPETLLDIAKENATTVSLTSDENGIQNYQRGVPFPIPEVGQEVIFNHITRYRGGSMIRNVAQVTPQANGEFSPVKFTEHLTDRVELADYEPGMDENVLFYFKQVITAPARLAGNVLLVHETLDQVKEARRAWLYNSGQRRVRRAPQVAYDGPGTAADGQRTSDNLDLFNGAPDRYNWELIGKKEMYIPYNSYKLSSRDLEYSDIIMPGHINPEHLRYELHRVWHVRATLKDGERHIYARRDFYVDEDSWQIAVVDHYDGRGDLWRVAEAHHIQAYDIDAPNYAAETLYDLMSGRYLVMGLTNEESEPYEFNVRARSRDFTPAALRRSGVR